MEDVLICFNTSDLVWQGRNPWTSGTRGPEHTYGATARAPPQSPMEYVKAIPGFLHYQIFTLEAMPKIRLLNLYKEKG